MNPDPNKPWEQLFPPPRDANPGSMWAYDYRLVRKRGEPLLLLPFDRCTGQHALSLYPAQTPAARLARCLLLAALRLEFPAGTRPARFFLDPQSPFVRFLTPSSPEPKAFPFALLLGNPRAAGRRFLFLLFDPEGRPAGVVKAGVGEEAGALIRRELAFLKSAPTDLLHAPAVRREFTSGGIEALALDYCDGPNPDAGDMVSVSMLLASWLDHQRTVNFNALPAAKRLREALQDQPFFLRVLTELDSAPFHPAVFHGDFAPWNIRVRPADGRWAVLDWERGEVPGPPAWDWFHFVIQPEILVRRRSPERIAARVGLLTASAEFRRYAAAADVAACVRPLLIAYLLYCCHVQRQAEGMPQLEALLQLLTTTPA